VCEKIQDYAAEATVFYDDDTTVTVLGLTPQQRAAALGEEAANTRSGIFTSGIVSIGEGHRFALFFTDVGDYDKAGADGRRELSRIRGALANLGHQVGHGTIAYILQEHGIEPAPERDRHTRWSTFRPYSRAIACVAREVGSPHFFFQK
jgi:hypothetical protein